MQGVRVLSVEGSLSFLTCAEFHARLAEVGERPGTRVVLDLAGVRELDSAGTGLLREFVEGLRSRGGDAVLARVPRTVHRSLAGAGIPEAVVIAGSVEQAIRALLR
jgi:anti-anti-sigma factor